MDSRLGLTYVTVAQNELNGYGTPACSRPLRETLSLHNRCISPCPLPLYSQREKRGKGA